MLQFAIPAVIGGINAIIANQQKRNPYDYLNDLAIKRAQAKLDRAKQFGAIDQTTGQIVNAKSAMRTRALQSAMGGINQFTNPNQINQLMEKAYNPVEGDILQTESALRKQELGEDIGRIEGAQSEVDQALLNKQQSNAQFQAAKKKAVTDALIGGLGQTGQLFASKLMMPQTQSTTTSVPIPEKVEMKPEGQSIQQPIPEVTPSGTGTTTTTTRTQTQPTTIERYPVAQSNSNIGREIIPNVQQSDFEAMYQHLFQDPRFKQFYSQNSANYFPVA